MSSSETSLQELLVVPRACLAPVTEILFLHDATELLAASGSRLTLYHLGTGAVIDECCVFDGQRIHGIRLSTINNRQLLLIFGGKYIALLQLHRPSPASTGSHVPRFARVWMSPRRFDLIWDVKLLRCGETCSSQSTNVDEFDLAIGYAHDRVECVTFHIESGASDTTSPLTLSSTSYLQQVQCEDRSLLYSMCLHGTCRHSLLVVGGTVFSHLLLWDASCTHAASSPSPPISRPVVHRVKGHEGVIFRLDVSEDATKIASVSDDRTVRVWRWKANQTENSFTCAGLIPLAQLLDPSLGSFHSGLTCYGHSARVWRALLFSSLPIVVSSSEDNTCVVWDSSSGEVLQKFQGQKGGLWSLAKDEQRKIVATGAGDGSIRVWSVEGLGQARQNSDTMEDVSGAASSSTSTSTNTRPLIVNMQELLPPLPVGVSTAASPSPSPDTIPDPASTSLLDPSTDSTDAADPPTTKAKLAHTPAASSSSSVPAQSYVSKAKKPQSEYCRELVLDVVDSQHARIFFVTSAGRIARMDLSTSDDGAQSHTTTLLHHHVQTTAAIVSLSLSPCKRWLSVGDQRGNMLLLSTTSDLAISSSNSTSPSRQPHWQPNVHPSALNFVHWLPTDDGGDSFEPSYYLITADALNEVKVWRFSVAGRGAICLDLKLTFRLPVSKARVTCAVTISLAQMREWSGNTATTAEEQSDDDSDDEEVDASTSPMNDIVDTDASSLSDGTFFVCGDSRGSVYAYFLPASTASGTSVSLALDRIMNVHEKATLTSLTVGPAVHQGVRLYSTATDGRVIEYSLSLDHALKSALTDSWIDKHNSSQPSIAVNHADEVKQLASWNLVRKRVHKLSHISTVKQVLFDYGSAASTHSRPRDVLVTGFHAMDFVVWNLTQNSQVRRWSCGGDKRAWIFQLVHPTSSQTIQSTQMDPSQSEPGFIFAYTRHAEENKESISSTLATGEIVIQFQSPSRAHSNASTSTVPALGCAIHGRLTTSLAAVSLHPNATVVVTASEDNTVKLFSLLTPRSPTLDAPVHTLPSSMPFRSSISCVATLFDHPDVVRSVCLSHEPPANNSTETVGLLFSGGGRDFLHCTRIRASLPFASLSPESPISVSIESLGSVGGKVFSIAGKPFAVRVEIEKDRMMKQDLRIMCVTAMPIPLAWVSTSINGSSAATATPSPFHLVVSGNSIGVLKFYVFDSSRMEFRLLAECPHHDYTVLSVSHIILGDDILIFSGSTDGVIKVWNVRIIVSNALALAASAASSPSAASSSIEPIFSHEAHQSGVDCMLVSPVAGCDDRTFQFFSGGDDEAIFAFTATLGSDGALSSVWHHLWPNAHCSAVKSMTLQDDRLYSVSYDQRVRTWDIKHSSMNGSVTIDLLSAGMAFIDVWDLAVIRSLPLQDSPSFHNTGNNRLSPLLLVGGQGLQVMQLASK